MQVAPLATLLSVQVRTRTVSDEAMTVAGPGQLRQPPPAGARLPSQKPWIR